MDFYSCLHWQARNPLYKTPLFKGALLQIVSGHDMSTYVMAREHADEQKTDLGPRLVIYPTRLVFYSLFSLAFCLSGILTMVDVIPYRMGLMALLVLPLTLLYGIKLDNVLIAYVLLAFVVVLSGLINSSSASDMVLFLRILVFSYLIYYLVERFVNRNNIEQIIKLCISIGLVQLPVIVFQRFTYDWLPNTIKENVSSIDYDFGTFNFKGDGAMSFFLILCVVFLLFDARRNRFIKHRIWVVTWLTLTVLLANSDISKILLVMVLLVYFATHLAQRASVTLMISVVLITGVSFVAGIRSDNGDKFQRLYASTIAGLQGDPRAVNYYLEGGYSRGGAIYYYLHNKVLWLGDGPNRYSDPFTFQRFRGNVGHIFTFYSEVGLWGWILSMAIFFLIVFSPRRGLLRVNLYSILLLLCVLGMSFTHQVMNDISVVMILCIMAKTHLIPSLPVGNNQRVGFGVVE